MKKYNIVRVGILGLLGAMNVHAEPSNHTESDETSDLSSLVDLLNVGTTTATKTEEKVNEAPGIITVLPSQEIRDYGAITLAEVLDRVTSIYMTGTFLFPTNMASIRGDVTPQYNNHVLVLLDGRPMRDNFTQGNNASIYVSFPLDRISQIEVVRGPGSVLYGSGAYTGVINIITKSASDQNTSVYARYGSFTTVNAGASSAHKFGELEVSGGLNVIRDNGWKWTATDETKVTNTVDWKKTGVGANLDMKLGDFSIKSYYGVSSQASMETLPIWGPLDPTAPYTPLDAGNQNIRFFVDGGYRKELTPWWRTSVDLSYNYSTFRLYNPGWQDDATRGNSKDILLEWTHYIKPFKDANIVAGFVANHQSGYLWEPEYIATLDSSNSNIYYSDINNSANPNPYVSVPDYSVIAYSGYLQADYRLIEFLKLVAGMQVNKVPQLDADVISRVGVITNTSSGWGSKILYSQAYRAASGIERSIYLPYVINGNSSLDPEKIGTFESQVSYTTKRYEGALTYFNSLQTNLVSRSSAIGSPPTPQYVNVGSSRSQGLELEGKGYLGDSFSVLGSMTYQRSLNSSGFWDTSGMPLFMAKAGVNYRSPYGFDIGIFDSYFGQNDNFSYRNNYNPQAQSYHWVTANVKYKATRSLELNLYGVNLLDQSVYYPEFVRKRIDSIPGRPGISAYLGATYTL